jgi:hypothetical protein
MSFLLSVVTENVTLLSVVMLNEAALPSGHFLTLMSQSTSNKKVFQK